MNKYRYPGAHPFSAQDRKLFYGREKDIDELYRLIELEKVVVLFSKSGMGKSSLLNAGVVPRLLESDDYDPLPIRLGAYRQGFDPPAEYTAYRLERIFPTEGQETFLDRLIGKDRSLWAEVKKRQILSGGTFNPILFFDQFEELSTYPRRWVERFKQELAELLQVQIPQRYRDVVERQFAAAGGPAGSADGPDLSPDELKQLHQPLPCKVLFAIRSDRLSQLNDLADQLPSILKNRFELRSLTRDQAEDAILLPAFRRDEGLISPPFDYTNEALDQMLDYLTQDGEEEIESFQLQILCQAMERKVIQEDRRLITPDELGNLESIYENYYDNQISLLERPEDQMAARRLIEEGLILEKEERRLSLYGGQIEQQYGIGPDLLAKLVDAHLLRSEASLKSGYTYELSHDTLVAPVLRAKRRRLAAEAQAKLKAENERRKAEVLRARREAEEERRMRLRNRRRAIIAFVFGATSFIFLLATLYFNSKANQAARLATSNSLVGLAYQLKERNPTYALRFANAAVRVSEDNERARQVYSDILANGRYPFFQQEIRAHGRIQAVGLLAPDGSRLVSAGDDSKARVWNRDGEELFVLGGHSGPVLALATLPEAGLVAAAGTDRSVRVWRVTGSKAELLSVLPDAHRGDIVTLAISGGGRWLASGSLDGRVKVWALGPDGPQADTSRFTLAHPEKVFDLAFSPLPPGQAPESVDHYLLTACEDNRARLWKMPDQPDDPLPSFDRPVDVLQDEKDIFAVAFHPQFHQRWLVLTGNLDQSVKLWRVFASAFWNAGTDQAAARLIGDRGSITAALFSADGRRVFAADEEGSIKMWNLPADLGQNPVQGEGLGLLPSAEFRGHGAAVSSMAISRVNDRLVSSSLDGSLKLWSFDQFLESTRSIPLEPEARLQNLQLSDDGTWLVAADDQGNLYQGEPDGAVVRVARLAPRRIEQLLPDPDGDDLLLRLDDNSWWGWDHEARDTFSTSYTEEPGVRVHLSEAFNTRLSALYATTRSPSEDVLVASDSSGKVLFSNVRSGVDRSLVFHRRRVDRFDFGLNDYLISFSRADQRLALWDKLGYQLLSITDRPDTMVAATLARHDPYLLIGSPQGKIEKWRLPERLLERGAIARLALEPSEWDNFGKADVLAEVENIPRDSVPPSDIAYKLSYTGFFENRYRESRQSEYGGLIEDLYRNYFNNPELSALSPGDQLQVLDALTQRRDSARNNRLLDRLYRNRIETLADALFQPSYYQETLLVELSAVELFRYAELLYRHYLGEHGIGARGDEVPVILRELLEDDLLRRAEESLGLPGLIRVTRQAALAWTDMRSTHQARYETFIRQLSSLLARRAPTEPMPWSARDLEAYLDLTYELYRQRPDQSLTKEHLNLALRVALDHWSRLDALEDWKPYQALLLSWSERGVVEGDSDAGIKIRQVFDTLASWPVARNLESETLLQIGKAFYETSYRYDYSDAQKAAYRELAARFLRNADRKASTEETRRLLALSQGSLAWRLLKLGQFDRALDYAGQAVATSQSVNFVKAEQMAYTNLALGYLFTGQKARAVDIYLAWKDQPYAYRPEKGTFRNVFVQDLQEFRCDPAFRELHPDVDEMLDLLDAPPLDCPN